MSYIAIDLWDKKVWLAVAVEGISMPKSIVARTKLIDALKKMQSEYDAHTFVVGLPYDLYGVRVKQLEKTQKFIGKLQEIFPDIKVEGYDERFSTLEARRDNDKDEVDDISASLILEGYLGSLK